MNPAIFSGREVLWPPADELLQDAERIRARLGEWPRADAPWRLCLALPEHLGTGDIVVLSDAHGHHDVSTRALAAGAAVLEASAAGATLKFGAATFALEGECSDDWPAALLAFLDCGFAPPDALCLAMAWRVGDDLNDTAWPSTLAHFPRVAGLPRAPRPFADCGGQLGLYPIVPSAEWVERLVDLGVKTIQLRIKSSDAAHLDREIARAVRAAAPDTRLFINDHWRAAMRAGAYGVHLGQEDLPLADLDAISLAGLRLGLSTHSYYEMLVAWHFRPSYIAVGAVFPTTTKILPTAPQGLARLAACVALLRAHVPLVAIGGIDLERLPSVLATGVGAAAVVRAITEAQDLRRSVTALQHSFPA